MGAQDIYLTGSSASTQQVTQVQFRYGLSVSNSVDITSNVKLIIEAGVKYLPAGDVERFNLFKKFDPCFIDPNPNQLKSIFIGSEQFPSGVIVSLTLYTKSKYPTNEIYIIGNLSAKQLNLKGPGVSLKVDKTGLLNGTIIPKKALTQGTIFKFRSGNKPTKTIMYGGISVSNKFGTGFYGANDYFQSFNIGGLANQIQEGTGLSITYRGNTINLTAKNGLANPSEYEFNSLYSLSQAINEIHGLKAIAEDNRLLINCDGSDKVVIESYKSFMNETLGLIDIPETSIPRFSTFQKLQEEINKYSDSVGLKATSVKEGLDICSLVATECFNISGKSNAKTTFERASIGDGTEIGRATVFIYSPKHELLKGNFVIISPGINDKVPKGIYMVGNKGNSDQFTVSVVDDDPRTFPAAGVLQVSGNFTWQQVSGEKCMEQKPTVAAAAAGAVTLTTLIPYTVNDVLHISGIGMVRISTENVSVPDGYYIVSGVSGGTFSFTPSAIATAPVNADYPTIVFGNIKVQKVGFVGAAGAFLEAGPDVMGNFKTRAMQTFQAVDGFPAKIRLFLPNNNYALGDYFSIDGTFPSNGAVVGGMTIMSDKNYKVIAVSSDWIEFIPGLADQHVPADARDVVYGPLAANVLPIDFRVNNYSQACEYLGMQQNKETFAPTYNQTDDKLSLSSGTHMADRFISKPMSVLDSLAIEHKLTIYFAKLDNNHWTVEIQAMKNLDGGYDVNIQNRIDGLINDGILKFNSDGSFASCDLENIAINWDNGSLTSHIKINLGQMAQKGDYSLLLSKDASNSWAELLPKDINSQWAQLNPPELPPLTTGSMLVGYHIGIDTIGQTLRNANLQIASSAFGIW